MDDPQELANRKLLLEVARREDLDVRLEAILKLSDAHGEEVTSMLMNLATDSAQPSSVRVQALVSLSWQAGVAPEEIAALLRDPNPEVQLEADRILRLRAGEREKSTGRPNTPTEWQEVLVTGGNRDRGRRIFYSALSTCSKCHTIGGSGGMLGPDLNNVGQSLSRRQIVHAILRPSDEFPPQYQAWIIRTRDGTIHTGIQLDHQPGRAIKIFTTAGEWARFEASEIETYRASSQSLMPDQLEANLTVEELRDLVSFLDSLE